MKQNRPIALALRGISKRFDRPAVEALDLTVYGGEFYVLVGPNGAGKTTTLRMVVGLLRPDAGSICIGGVDALAGCRQADDSLALRRADDLRQTDALRVSRIRRRALAHRTRHRESPRSRVDRLARLSNRTRTNAARDFPRACARRWRWPVHSCTTRS